MAKAASLQPVRMNRIPPHNLDAEQSVLGAMLESKEAIANVVEVIRPEDFYKPSHKLIYDVILELYGRGEAADAITVADELARRGELDTIGGKPYIHGLLEAYPTASSARHYARIVEEHALLRRLVDAGVKVQEIGFSMPEDPAEAVDQAESIVYQVADRRMRDTVQPLRELLIDNIAAIEALYERGESVTGIASGFPDLDEMTSGFQPSNLVIVAARPAMGKCLSGDTLVLDGESRATVALDRFVREKRRLVMALDPKGRARPAEVADWVDNGERECWLLRTRSGRQVVATSNHPFLTVEGWVPLSDLTPSAAIATMRGGGGADSDSRSDLLPREVWRQVAKSLARRHMSLRDLLRAAGNGGWAAAERDRPLARRRFLEFAAVLQDPDLEWLASPDVEWDEVAEITPVGPRPVYDLEVPAGHNFIAAGIYVHNSSLMNDFALHAATKQNLPVAIFSLEMSKSEVAKRFLASEARIDSQRLNKGALQEQDWTRLSAAAGRLAEAPIFIDDSANITLMEMRAKCRRMKAKYGLGMVFIDYLQLMQGPGRSENRQQEVSEISRSLKILARELEVPVICASQLNRMVESRADKRPLLGDLRESGCLTGDARVARADTGRESTFLELFLSGEQNIPVWTLDEDLRVVQGTMTHVWCSGVKKVFKLTTNAGRVIRASGNHPFLTLDGWRALEDLAPGERIAIPRAAPAPQSKAVWRDEEVILLAHMIGDGSCLRRLPTRYATKSFENAQAVMDAAGAFGVRAYCKNEPRARSLVVFLPSPHRVSRHRRNPVVQWMDALGLYDKRSHEKFIPPGVFGLPDDQVALFLRHLWATDGHISLRKLEKRSAPTIYYASNSKRLIDDVAQLLLRFGIVARIHVARKAGYRDCYQLNIRSRESWTTFVRMIGGFGAKQDGAAEVAAYLHCVQGREANTQLVMSLWEKAQLRAGRLILPGATGPARSDTRSQFGVAAAATLVQTRPYMRILRQAAAEAHVRSDVFWDEIRSIEHDGEEPVFDAEVGVTHNFIANGIVVKNSIEQDSDLVMFIYRDEVYNPDTEHRGEAELHVAKHRNGPTGKVTLAFMNQYTKFASIAKVGR